MNGIPADQGGPLVLAVRHLGGDDRLRGRDRHLLGPPAGRRAARPGPRGASPRSSASPRWGRSPPAWARSTSSRSATPPDSPERRSLMELRTILDWEVARRLKSVPGVVEVNALGGELKTYEVELDPDRLLARGISLEPGLRGDPAQQRQRRRRLHPAQRRAAGHPRRGPGRQRSRTSRTIVLDDDAGRHADLRPRRRRRSASPR